MDEFKGTKHRWYLCSAEYFHIKNEAGQTVFFDTSRKNFEYDAKLIIKAPEMLNFLIKLKQEWEKDDLRYGGENFHMEEITNLIKEATEI